jgi:hypothetical protein
MNSPIVPQIVCQRCRAPLDAEDNYCRRCGAPTANVAGGAGGPMSYFARSATDSSVQRPRWWDSPFVILPMLFLVIGPLALPMLWRSRQFSQLWKIILTVLVTLLTGWLCWQLWLAMQKTAAMLDQIQKQL